MARGVGHAEGMESTAVHATTIRSLALRMFVGLIALNAAIAIGAILGIGSGDDVQWRVLGTTSVVTLASLVVAANAAAIARRQLGPLPLGATVLSALAAGFTIYAIWADIDGDNGYAELTAVLATLGVAGTLMSLISLPALAHPWDRAQWLGHASTFGLGTMTVVAIIDDASMSAEAFGIVSVLLAAAMLLILIGTRLGLNVPAPTTGASVRFCPMCGEPDASADGDGACSCSMCGARFRVALIQAT